MNAALPPSPQFPGSAMKICMISYAVDHILRISRCLAAEQGHIVLLGGSGTGRRTLTTVATYLLDYELVSLRTCSLSEGGKNFSSSANTAGSANATMTSAATASVTGSKSKIKTTSAGTSMLTDEEERKTWVDLLLNVAEKGEPRVLVLQDADLLPAGRRDIIGEVLSTGCAVGIFTDRDEHEVYEKFKVACNRDRRKQHAHSNMPNMSKVTMFDAFEYMVARCRRCLRVVVCLTHGGAGEFSSALRSIPALAKACAFDYFSDWPEDEMSNITRDAVESYLIDLEMPPATIERICGASAVMHSYVKDFRNELSFVEKQTPSVFLYSLATFCERMKARGWQVMDRHEKYKQGLQILGLAADGIRSMREGIEKMVPVIEEKAKQVKELQGNIETNLASVDEIKSVIEAEGVEIKKEAQICKELKEECATRLGAAMPAFNAAIKSLKSVKKEELDEVRQFPSPPEKVKLTLEAICIMLGLRPKMVADPNDWEAEKVADYWGLSQHLLGESKSLFISLETYDKDNMDDEIVKKIKNDYLSLADFAPEAVKAASVMCYGMCCWVHAVITYHDIYTAILPKRKAFEEASLRLHNAREKMASNKQQKVALEESLIRLQTQRKAAIAAEIELKKQAESAREREKRASDLLGQLNAEKVRWTEEARRLAQQLETLPGDLFLASMSAVYLGVYSPLEREKVRKRWISILEEHEIPVSDTPQALYSSVMYDEKTRLTWHEAGMSRNAYSSDGCASVAAALCNRRWPLLLDPQGLAFDWVCRLEEAVLGTQEVAVENIEEELERGLAAASTSASAAATATGGKQVTTKGGEAKRAAKRRTMRVCDASLPNVQLESVLENAASNGDVVIYRLSSKGIPRAFSKFLTLWQARVGMSVDRDPTKETTTIEGPITPELDVSPDFRIYFTSDSWGPTFPSSTTNNVTMVNFCVTQAGLEETILNMVALEQNYEVRFDWV